MVVRLALKYRGGRFNVPPDGPAQYIPYSREYYFKLYALSGYIIQRDRLESGLTRRETTVSDEMDYR